MIIEQKKISCDLFSIENPYEFFDQPDVVLHLAWQDGFIHNSENHILNLSKHHFFLEALFKSDVKRVAVLGTMHEVGFYEGSIDETTPCNPLSLYGISKNSLRLEAEYFSKLYSKKLQWLRGFYIVGNTSHGSSIFSKIVQAAEKGVKEFPFTLGLNQFDFLDYSEFCYQVVAAISQDEISGTINICSGYPEKLADRVERFISENNFDIKLQYGAFPDRPYDSKAIWGNNSKISAILNNKQVN
ncbi:NAD-dependent epimerase/dehydratase family protein [Streptococcus uberis]|uniref:NAD-dependent epimerase/dehydratase family protein n=1 Tax=Streptococcus uberis TaxID=1349 RepID=UPI0027DCED05|nr:NAD(P)-dependent oxidoreductase [Streptococcus uberis]